MGLYLPESTRPKSISVAQVRLYIASHQILGRMRLADYHISIHTRPRSPTARRPPVRDLSFSTYGPNNQDLDLQSVYSRTLDDKYVETLPNGGIISFKTRNIDRPSDSPGVPQNDPIWGQEFSATMYAFSCLPIYSIANIQLTTNLVWPSSTSSNQPLALIPLSSSNPAHLFKTSSLPPTSPLQLATHTSIPPPPTSASSNKPAPSSHSHPTTTPSSSSARTRTTVRLTHSRASKRPLTPTPISTLTRTWARPGVTPGL